MIENETAACVVIRGALADAYPLVMVTTLENGVDLARRDAYAVVLLEACFEETFRRQIPATCPIVAVHWPFTKREIEDRVARALLESSAG